MSPHWHEIGKPEDRLASLIQPPTLHRSIVPGMRFHPQTRHDLVVGLLQLQLPVLLNRPPILWQVACSIALARVFGMFELIARNEVARIGKRRNSISFFVELRISTRVIEMQMSVNDDRDLFRSYARGQAQCICQRSFPRDAIHPTTLSRPLLADTRLDQYSLGTRVDKQTIHIHTNTILVVGRTDFRPEIARYNTKHRASIEAKLGVRNNLDAIIAKLHQPLLGASGLYCCAPKLGELLVLSG